MDIIRSASDQASCFLDVLHDLGLAARYCDRIALLCRGRILAIGAFAAAASLTLTLLLLVSGRRAAPAA